MEHGQNASADQKGKRIAAPFTDDELEQIDAWGFERRMRNRTDVIRALVFKGMDET